MDKPELKNLWNPIAGFEYLRLSFTADSKTEKTIAWAVFKAYWGWPFLTVSLLAVFWHAVFRFVGW